jgi:hypothetical protein
MAKSKNSTKTLIYSATIIIVAYIVMTNLPSINFMHSLDLARLDDISSSLDSEVPEQSGVEISFDKHSYNCFDIARAKVEAPDYSNGRFIVLSKHNTDPWKNQLNPDTMLPIFYLDSNGFYSTTVPLNDAGYYKVIIFIVDESNNPIANSNVIEAYVRDNCASTTTTTLPGPTTTIAPTTTTIPAPPQDCASVWNPSPLNCGNAFCLIGQACEYQEATMFSPAKCACVSMLPD